MNIERDVTIYEVGPRDGLQNEPDSVATEIKRQLLERLIAAGIPRIEMTSFVSPKWIPKLADADDLARIAPRSETVSYSALTPNQRGYERFQQAKIPVLAFVVSVSETHNKKNLNRSVDEHLEAFKPIAEQAKADGVALRMYASTCCGCPYEGRISTSQAMQVMKRLISMGADEIAIADSLGVGTPSQIRDLVRAAATEFPVEKIGLHLHDTYGRALVNLMAGYEEGIRTFDASLGGLGGCPYAPGASGNLATEDVVDLFEGEGIRTGVDLDSLVSTTLWLENDVLKRPLPGRVFRAKAAKKSGDQEE